MGAPNSPRIVVLKDPGRKQLLTTEGNPATYLLSKGTRPSHGFADLQYIADCKYALRRKRIYTIDNEALNLHESHIKWKQEYVRHARDGTEKGCLIIFNEAWKQSKACQEEVERCFQGNVQVSILESIDAYPKLLSDRAALNKYNCA